MSFAGIQKLSSPEEVVLRLNTGRNIGYTLAKNAFLEVLNDKSETSRRHYMVLILNGLMIKKPCLDEITGLLDAIYELDKFDPSNAKNLPTSKKVSITMSGSGKKGLKTVNLSSLAAFVAAAHPDIAVAKLCAPSTSSMTGSEDFIHKLGANRAVTNKQMEAIYEQLGIGFFRVEDYLPEFTKVYSGTFYAPHALSFGLAGLARNFKTDKLLYGLTHPDTNMALEVMRHYDQPHALIVNSSYDGIHFIDEVTDIGAVNLHGYKDISEPMPQSKCIYFNHLTGLTSHKAVNAIRQESDPDQNIIKGLSGLIHPDSDLAKEIALNAAVLIQVCTDRVDMEKNYNEAIDIIRSGSPISLLRSYVQATGGNNNICDSFIDQSRLYEHSK